RSLHPWQQSSAPPGRPIRARQPFKSVLSSPANDLRRPGGAQGCCHGWSDAEGGAQPVGPGRVNGRPGGAEEARGVQGASEAQDAPDVSSAPPGRNPCWRNLPRVALALLAPPVATNLRPSGAESILATPSTGC